MSAWREALDALHLLRPAWCALLPVILVGWWWLRRRRAPDTGASRHIAPHLERALRVGADGRRRLMPVDTLALTLVLLTLGAAGPTWSRIPNPLVTQTAPLVVVLEVNSGMQAKDVPPSRLARAKHKIRDLLETRAGADTALIAYAGTAHRVVPLTDDPGLIRPYLEGLSPEIMPEPGDNATDALALAEELLARQSVPGAMLFVGDGLDAKDRPAFTDRQGDADLAFLVMAPAGMATPGIDAVPDAKRVRVGADDSDIQRLERVLAAAYRRALLDDDSLAWEDRGWWLAWPAALLALLGFRRGWSIRWQLVLVVGLAGLQPLPARAGPLADAFLTPDQQGRWWVERGDYARAAEHFIDPAWQGYALYRDGQYAQAAEMLDRLDTADAAFTRGLALIRNRQYRPAVAAFEQVLARDPDYPDGERHLALAKEILAHVEEARDQSDTGEDRGIGADEVVFDNEADRGERTEQVAEDGDGLVSAEQWMSTLDTRTEDYLRQRFAVEAREASP
ncbi:VWA domain-containing protein [Halomonas sp. 1390]|uniref:VWA domain-containing protein n=1 Tax=Halomonas sp. B23F22_3 TaxID=3459516 RepID=UPI00373F16DB